MVVEDVERSGWWSVKGAEVFDAADNCAEWTGEALAVGCMTELFTFDAVLLGGEGEGDKCGG